MQQLLVVLVWNKILRIAPETKSYGVGGGGGGEDQSNHGKDGGVRNSICSEGGGGGGSITSPEF